MLRFLLVITFIYFLNINLSAKEFDVFPGLGLYKNIDSTYHYSTINDTYFYNPSVYKQAKLLNNNRLLLKIITQGMNFKNQLTKSELNQIDEEQKKVIEILEKIEFANIIAEATVAGGTLNMYAFHKALFEILTQKLTEELGQDKKEQIELIVGTLLNFIDIAVEKSGINPAIIKTGLSEVVGKAFAVITLFTKETKFIHTMWSSLQVNKVRKEQAKNALVFYFLQDYIFKYKSDISKMQKDILYKFNNNKMGFPTSADKNNFWFIWYYYNYLHFGDNLKLFPINELYDSALKTADYIEKYSVNNMFDLSLRQHIDEDINEKTYVTLVNGINRLYYIPKINEEQKYIVYNGWFGGHTYSEIENFKFTVYFKAPTVNKLISKPQPVNLGNVSQAYVRLVDNASIELKIIDPSGKEIENRKISIKPFYIPSYFDDIPENYQFMPSISKMFNQGYINGYQDTLFHPKDNASIGQFLSMITQVAFSQQKYGNDTNKITFTRYKTFLENKGININFPNNSSLRLQDLDKPITRKHVAKIISNILNLTNQQKSCGLEDSDGWDECSNYLKNTIGVQGSIKLSINHEPVKNKKGEIVHEFKPNNYITRDELTAMVIATKEYLEKLGSLK